MLDVPHGSAVTSCARRQVLHERPEDAVGACDLGVPRSLAALLSRANGETGEAALALLAALADDAAVRERLRQARPDPRPGDGRIC